jgi:hypothetical protein
LVFRRCRFRQIENLFAVCLKNRGFCLVSWTIRQTLALDASHGARRPFPVSNSKAGTVVIAELKFSEITL